MDSMTGNIVGLSFPRNDKNLGLEPSILSVLPRGDNVVYSPRNDNLDDSKIERYLCSVYIAGMDEFRQWAAQHDPKKVVVGGYHPTRFPENFLNLAETVVMGPCDDINVTLSQSNVLYEMGHYDKSKVGNARFAEGRILRTLEPNPGMNRTYGEISDAPEKPTGRAEVLKDRILPGVLTFKNPARMDLYNIRNNQQVIPDKMPYDLATSVNTSFGCYYKCDFCCTPVMFKRLTSKPLDLIRQEVDNVKRALDEADNGHKQRFLFIRDENFTLQKDYRKRLEIIASTNAKVYLFASANTLTEEVVKALKANNVYMVCLGLEDPTKFDDYPKNKHLYDAVSILKRYGIYTYLSFIVDPTKLVGKGDGDMTGAEKGKEFYELLSKHFNALQPEMVCGNFLMPFPGTRIWDDYYWMVSEDDFKHYDSKTPFLVKNELVATKMKYFMFKAQQDYFMSELYNNKVRHFEVGDTLHLRFVELEEQMNSALKLMDLRP